MNQIPSVPTKPVESASTEKALHESKEHLSALIHQTLGGIAETDVQGAFLLVNDRYCAITGYTREELIGQRRMQELTHPDDLPRNLELFARCVTEGIPFEIEKRYIRKDGSLVWVNNNVSAIRRSDGRIQSLLAITLDITKRKQAEEAQRASETFSQLVLGSLPAQIVVLDEEGTIISVNEEWANFTLENGGEDYLHNTGIGVNYLEVCRRVTGEDAALAEQVGRGIHAVLIGAQTQFALEYPCHSPTMQRWFTLFCRPLLRSPGGAVISHVDITERKLAEQALRSSEEKFRAIVSQASAGICRADMSGKFIQVNQKMCELLGYSLDELIGKTFWEITFRDDLLENKCLIERLKNSGQSFEMEKRLIQKGGDLIWVNISVAAINDDNGKLESTVAVVIGIEDRKRAEEALRDREERLRLAVEAAGGGSFTIYYDDRLNEADERTLWLFGFKPGEWQGDEESVFARLVPEDRVEVQQAIAQAIEQHLPYHSEFRVKLPDGSVRWLIGLGKAEYDAHGKPLLLRGVNLDITDRKQAEEKLRESEERFRNLVEQAVDGIFLADVTGHYVDANSAGLQMVGYSLEELRQLTVNDLIVPQELPRMPEQFTNLGTGNVVVSEWRFRRKDSSTFIGEVVGRRLPDGRLLGILRDVTARRQIEDALRASQSTLAAALASMSDAVFISDTQGRFIEFNEAFATFHKFRNKDECAQTLQEYPALLDVYFPNGELAPLEQWAVPRALRGETAVNAEYHLRRKDTGENWIGSYNFAPIRDRSGDIVGSVVVGHDITARKQAEASLQRAHDELAQANAELLVKENERRELVRRLVSAQEAERQRLSLELHDQTSQHLAALRMMLATLAEPLQSHQEQLGILTQVQQLTEQLSAELRSLAWELRPMRLQETGLAMVLEQYVKEWSARCGIAADFHFRGDWQRRFPALHEITLYRVVQEALTNVLKHAQAQHITVALEYFPNRLRAIVEDDGVGFAPDSLNETNGGLGLGGMRERLALVDGGLEIESSPGHGTAIYLNLPLPRNEQPRGTS